MPQPIEVRKVLLQKVTDASGLEELIEKGVFTADQVIGVVGKTEGNGGVNDYTRLLADRAFREVLVEKGTRGRDAVSQIPLAWSGGTDGVLSPHATIFARIPASQAPVTDEPRLSVGVAMSEQILPEEIGHIEMVEKVAAGVRKAMDAAGISDPADVHYVQTKTPLLTLETINEAKRRGHGVWTEDTLESMDLSNGTSGLGIALALGEIDAPRDEQIMTDRSLYSSVASCSSGVELTAPRSSSPATSAVSAAVTGSVTPSWKTPSTWTGSGRRSVMPVSRTCLPTARTRAICGADSSTCS